MVSRSERRRRVQRNCPPQLADRICWSPRRPPLPRRHQAVQQRLPPGAAAGELPPARRLHHPAAGAADAGAPDGAAAHDRRRAGRVGGADHRGHAALRLRPLRQEGRLAHLARRPARRRHAGHRRRRPGADDDAARPAGARLLLGPGRPPHRDRRAGRPLPRPATSPTPSSSPPTSATPRPPPSSPGCSACPSRPGSKQRLADDRVVIDAIVGDVAGKRAIILDDEIATGGSIVELLDRLKDARLHRGVGRLHPRPVRRQGRRAAARPPDDHRGRHDRHRAARRRAGPSCRSARSPGLFAEAISRIHHGRSVSSLFEGVDPTHAPPQPRLPF